MPLSINDLGGELQSSHRAAPQSPAAREAQDEPGAVLLRGGRGIKAKPELYLKPAEKYDKDKR